MESDSRGVLIQIRDPSAESEAASWNGLPVNARRLAYNSLRNSSACSDSLSGGTRQPPKLDYAPPETVLALSEKVLFAEFGELLL